MLGYIIRINRESYVGERLLTPDFFQAKIFDFEELKEWLNYRITEHEKILKYSALKDTDIEIMLVEE